ncbi:glucose-6-phosphate dehydrogenase [Candidatus Dependentiae bacterium]|nr:glucose-6-phosphate dehydrogenase [Candidatus Dependentiae bacterium]
MNQCTFVILGATGDLTKRKLIPAMYHLIKKNKIKNFALVGAAITDTTIQDVLQKSQKFIQKPDRKVWKQLEQSSYYCQLDFHNQNDFQKLQKLLIRVEKKHKLPGNRIFYLATLPEHFETITANLSKNKIVQKGKQTLWSRVVYEKPFGHDLKSARKINRCIAKLFDESQVYRIDHFLLEELVTNIALVRFSNLFFEPLWNNKYIESVQIVLHEKIGIEGRGAFYDHYGALKDVVQNHMLQMLALIAMEPPKKLSGEYIRDAKVRVLKRVQHNDILLGQYKEYQDERGVNPKSRTETFTALRLEIANRRWKGVPFFLKTGKCLSKKETSIHIKFKNPTCLQQDCPAESNYLTIQIQPREGFYLQVNTKIPGETHNVTPVKMDFCHACHFGPNTPQAYETLLSEVLEGDHSVFVRFDEIEYSWKLIDKILAKKHPIYTYKKNTDGPKQLAIFNKKNNIRWRT